MDNGSQDCLANRVSEMGPGSVCNCCKESSSCRLRSMQLKDAHHRFGTSEFESELFAELYEDESKLPLEDFCGDGSPSAEDFVKLSELALNDPKANDLTGSFVVRFTESRYSGCRDIDWKDRVCGRVKFTLDLTTGWIEFESEISPERDPETY